MQAMEVKIASVLHGIINIVLSKTGDRPLT